MARRTIAMIEINEVIYRWHKGENISAIERSLGADRKTIRKYVRLAKAAGLSRGHPLPPDAELAALIAPLRQPPDRQPLATPGKDRLEPYRAHLEKWAKDPAVSIRQMHRLLKEQFPELTIGYTCLRQFVQSQFRPVEIANTVRLEFPPGRQAQVDFGYAGLMRDPKSGKRRKAWAFVMTLSYSRHRFVRFVFHQDSATWIDCHIRAFQFFGGVPATILLDNLKAGVIKADIYDPTLNRAYQECERHYGFIADPAKVRTPEHKGRVERTVATVKGQILAGRDFTSIDDANQRALTWCRDDAGMAIHGTTKQKPFLVFTEEEQPRLQPLPDTIFEIARWRQCQVHIDHHVVFGGAYYSLPTRYIGSLVWVRGTDRLVQIFQDEQLIKSHVPATPGTFRTDPDDYPENKRLFLLKTSEVCRTQAAQIGPATAELVGMILTRDSLQNLRKAQAVLRLAGHFGPMRMEAACRRAVQFDNLRFESIKAILIKGLDHLPIQEVEPQRMAAPGFRRPQGYFSHGTSK